MAKRCECGCSCCFVAEPLDILDVVRIDARLPSGTAIVTPHPLHQMLIESGVPQEGWEDEVKRMVQDGRIVVMKLEEEDEDAGNHDAEQ